MLAVFFVGVESVSSVCFSEILASVLHFVVVLILSLLMTWDKICIVEIFWVVMTLVLEHR